MYRNFSHAPPNFDCAVEALDDLGALLSNDAGATELGTQPAKQSRPSQEKQLQVHNVAPSGPGGQTPALDEAAQKRKQRALDKSRAAQKRFRDRQRQRVDSVQAQLDATSKQLRDLRAQQQQLQTRNVLLEKIAQLSKEQTSEEYMVWQNKQAVLDFTCAHTQQGPEGFTLTLTIFGHAEKKECRTVSSMSVAEIAALWTEYMRKLGKCLLALQHDHHGSARPLLDSWVAEVIALICCVRVYNPEFLKAIDSTAMDGSQNSRLSRASLTQHMALLELSDDQIQDSLYIRRIVAARAAELELQQRQVCAQMAAKSASKQHPSDHLAAAREVADKMKLMGEEEYKLHGIVTDALFNGVFTSMQDAMALVHMYPFLPDALEYLECIAASQPPAEAREEPVTNADWEALLAYCAKVTAADHFCYVPLLNSNNPSSHAAAAAAASVITPHPSTAAPGQHPSPASRSVRFGPDPASRQQLFSAVTPQAQTHSSSPSSDHLAPAYSQSPGGDPRLRTPQSQMLPTLGESQMVQSSKMSRQVSRQGSNQITLTPSPKQVPSWVPQSQAAQHVSLQPRQDLSSSHLSSPSQRQMSGDSMLHFGGHGQLPNHAPAFVGFSQGVSHPAAPPAAVVSTPFYHAQFQPGQLVQTERGQMFVSQAPVQLLQQGSAVSGLPSEGLVSHGSTSQGYSNQVHVMQAQASDQLPAWLSQNLGYTHGTPSQQLSPASLMHNPRQMNSASHRSQSSNPKMVYPTAAMRSQQLSTVQTSMTHSANSVQAPLAPFLNEQLKRMLKEGGPSGRRGF